MSAEGLVNSFSRLFDKHSKTILYVLSLILLGISLWGFTLISDTDDLTRWMYFMLAFPTIIAILGILYFITRNK